jgi:hypothetical protein
VNNPPVVFPGHRVLIALPQETHIVRAHQLVDAGWVTTELGVVHADRPGVLQAPVDGFRFLVAANRLRYLGRGNGEREKHQQHHEQHAEKQKAVFMSGTGLWPSVGHWRRGKVCVLWYGMSSTWTDAELILTTR